LALLPAALIAVKLASVVWAAFSRPVIDPDILGCYALGAKMIFLNKTILLNGPWADKPLMPFLWQAWPSIGLDFWNDTLLTLPNPLLFLSFLIIFYSALARHFKRWYALLSTLLLATMPLLVFHAGTAYTDWPQALYYSAGTFYLFLFMKEFRGDREAAAGSLLAGAALLGLTVWAKKSGLYYAAIDLAALLIFLSFAGAEIKKTDWRLFFQSAVIFLAIAAPWLLFNQLSTFRGYYVEVASQNYIDLETAGPRPQTLPALSALYRNTFLEDNWHLLGLLFAAALVLYPKKALAGPRLYLLLIIALQLTALFVLFRFTNLYRFVHDETLLNRLTLHFAPVILFFCAQILGENFSKSCKTNG